MMTSDSLSSAGLYKGTRLRTDRRGLLRFRPGLDSHLAIGLVRNLQLAYLRGELRFESPVAQQMTHLMLFEAVMPSNVAAAAAAMGETFVWRDQCVLQWSAPDGRLDSRILSPLLQPASLDGVATTSATGTVLARLSQQLLDDDRAEIGDLQQLLGSYYAHALPGSLFSHVIGAAPHTALPRTTLAREQSRLALAHERVENKWQGAEAFGSALEHYFQMGTRGSGGWLVERIVQTCVQYSDNKPGNKGRMLQSLLPLSTQLDGADSISALILCWVIRLIEEGSVVEPDPRPGTVAAYVRVLATPLRAQLAGKDLPEMMADQYAEEYAAILDATAQGNRGNCGSAIKAWHLFLCEWLDAPPLEAASNGEDVIVIPRANVVWPHETYRMHDWIDQSHLDERLQYELHLALHLLTALRLRAKELFLLRLHNVIDHGETIEVEVAPMIRDGPTKSESGRRTQTIDDPKVVGLMRNWISRRRNEGAHTTDFVFGDPHRPAKIYRLGVMYVLLNRLLKDATGDPTVSLHTFSHTWVTSHLLDAFTHEHLPDTNPLELIAKDAGHLSAATTLFHYFHGTAAALRFHLDAEIRQLPLTSHMAETLSGIRATTLRQRTKSSGCPRNEVYWDAILGRTPSTSERTACSRMRLEEPTLPPYLQQAARPQFRDVVNTLKDLSAGFSVEEAAMRLGRPAHWVNSVLTETKRQFKDLRVRRSLANKAPLGMRSTSADIHLQNLASLGIDFGRSEQLKLAGVAAFLQRHCSDMTLLKPLVDVWRESFDRGYLLLADATSAGMIFKLLHDCNVGSDRLAIACCRRNPSSPTPEESVREAEFHMAFHSVFRLPPLIDGKPLRRNRPRYYLIWSGVPLESGKEVSSASSSLDGFHALMLGMAAHTFMTCSATSGSVK